MNSFEQAQAADFAVELLSSGSNPESLVHVIYNPDLESGLFGLSTTLAPNYDLTGLVERYYTLGQLVDKELHHLKVEALDFYEEVAAVDSRAETLEWLKSGESHKIAEALVNLSWSYANVPVVAYCRKHRSQW